MTCKLSLATLDQAKATAQVPSYSRSDLSAGIVHFGVGNFTARIRQSIWMICSTPVLTMILQSSALVCCHPTL